MERTEGLGGIGRRLVVFAVFAFFMIVLGSCAIPQSRPVDNYVGAPDESPSEKPAETVGTEPEMSGHRSIAPLFPIAPGGPLQITVSDAVLLGLGNNWQFQVERLNPALQKTLEEEERAIFDPVLRADALVGRERTESDTVTRGFDVSAGVSQFFPTGTTLDFELGAIREKDNPYVSNPNDEYSAYVDFSITQALLRGAGTGVNLATLRQAQLDTRASEYELRGFAEALAAEIENTYWDFLLAREEVKVYSRSLELATRLARETKERIDLGQLARTEIYFAEAEASVREQNLINAQSREEKTRLALLQMINPPGKSLWDRAIEPKTAADIVEIHISDLDAHLRLARRMRPDVNQARLTLQRGGLEIVKTRNGLLPRLDLFINLGRTGYSRSFGGSVRDISVGDGGLNAFVGLSFDYPLFNRKAKAAFDRSKLQLEQEQEALRNLIQLAEEDVLSAYVEINRTLEQIKTSRSTVRYQQQKLDAEIDRYRMGESTMYRVAQAERDLVESQVFQVQARIGYLKALDQFYLAEGSLLLRWGIEAPGEQPVEANAE